MEIKKLHCYRKKLDSSCIFKSFQRLNDECKNYFVQQKKLLPHILCKVQDNLTYITGSQNCKVDICRLSL